MFKKLLFAVLFLLVAVPVYATDAVTWAMVSQGTNWVCISADILADGSGNVASPTVTNNLPDNLFSEECWVLARAAFVPDGGATAPDALYDITLLDSTTSTDILGGLGGNLSQTVSTHDFPVTVTNGGPQYVFSLPVAAGSGYGADNGSTIYLWLVRVNKVTVAR